MVGIDVGQWQSSETVEIAMHMGRMQVEHTDPMVEMTVGHGLWVLVEPVVVEGGPPPQLDVGAGGTYEVLAQPVGHDPWQG
jgi:hypothetical protein